MQFDNKCNTYMDSPSLGIHSSQQPPSLKEIESKLLKRISRYDQAITVARKNLSKAKSARKRVKNSINSIKIRCEYLNEDCEEAKSNEVLLTEKSKALEFRMGEKSRKFETDMKSLNDLKEKIERHTHQVLDNILKINQSSNEWEFANKLTTKICDISKQSAYSAFQRWLLLWPAIQLWLSNDAAAVSSIYSIAHLEGITSEIMAHLATKKNLEKFVESVHVYTSSELKGHAAKVEEDQKTRATQFDNMHAAMIKHCISLIRNCESLKKDIESREEFRQTINRQLMDLGNCLDEDSLRTMSVAEMESTKPLAAAAQDLKTRLQRQRQQQLEEDDRELGRLELERSQASQVPHLRPPSTPSRSGRFTAPEDDDVVMDSPVRMANVATPIRTLKNTALNAVARHSPSRIDHNNMSKSGGGGDSNSSNDSTAAFFNGTFEDTVGRFADATDKGESALPQVSGISFDSRFDWYLKKFHYRKRSAAWNWCNWHSGSSMRAVLQTYPQLHVPSIVNKETRSGVHIKEIAAVRALTDLQSDSIQMSMFSKSFQNAFANQKLKEESQSFASPRPPSTAREASITFGVRKPLKISETEAKSTPAEEDSLEKGLIRPVVGKLSGQFLTNKDITLLTAAESRRMLRKVQKTTSKILNTTVKEISEMLAQSTKQPSVSLGADDMAFDWDMQNQRLSVDDKAVDLNMKLTDIFAPCKDSFEEWMLSSWGAKYQETTSTLANLVTLLHRQEKQKSTDRRTAPRDRDELDDQGGSDSEKESIAHSLRHKLVQRPHSGNAKEIVEDVVTLSNSLVSSIERTLLSYEREEAEGGGGDSLSFPHPRDKNMPSLPMLIPDEASSSLRGLLRSRVGGGEGTPSQRERDRQKDKDKEGLHNHLLNCMETIVGSEHYFVTLGWLAKKQQYLLTASTQMGKAGDDRLIYKVFEISITESVLQYLKDHFDSSKPGQVGSGMGAPGVDSTKLCHILIGQLAVEQVAHSFYDTLVACMTTSFNLTNPFLFSWQQQQQPPQQQQQQQQQTDGEYDSHVNERLFPQEVIKVCIHSPHIFELEEMLEKRAATALLPVAEREKYSTSSTDKSHNNKTEAFPYILQVMTLRQKDGNLRKTSILSKRWKSSLVDSAWRQEGNIKNFYKVSTATNDLQNGLIQGNPIFGKVIDHAVDLTKIRPGETIDVPYEVTVSHSMRDFWQSAFYSHDRINTSTPFARSLNLQDQVVPFHLMLFLAGSMSHADHTKVQVGFSKANYHWPAFAGDTFKKRFVILSLRSTSDKKNSIVNISCQLFNQRGVMVFSCEKKMMLPLEVPPSEVQIAPPATANEGSTDFLSHLIRQVETLQSMGSQTLEPLRPGQLVLHTLTRPLSETHSMQLATLGRLTHERHFNTLKYSRDELYIPGGLVLGLTSSLSSRDLHEVLFEELLECSFPNNLHPADSVGALTYVSEMEEHVSGDIEALTVRTIGVKKCDVHRTLADKPLPSALFVDPLRKLRPAAVEELLRVSCPELSKLIVCIADRRIYRQAPKQPPFLL